MTFRFLLSFAKKSTVMKLNMIKVNYNLQSLLTDISVMYFHKESCGEHEILVMIITVHVTF